MSTRSQLLDEVQLFVNETGMTEGQLGHRACRENRVVGWLREGRSITIDRLDQIRNFMAAERERRSQSATAPTPPGTQTEEQPQ